MNHLGDTNKMVETLRTDILLTAILDSDGFVHNGNCPQRWVNHAREIELELNEWKRWCKEKEQALDDLAKVFSQQQDRIKRLESVEKNHSDVLKAIDNWMKQQEAKEAKP